ncbi:MAG TPA: hypothetical protein VKF62_05020 [Planctomycetota bacterium]|nr:hypothetical protein [Planctomycetota bacterium]
MDRRTLLKLAGAGAAGIVLPGFTPSRLSFLRSASAGELDQALKRARERGKPLLLFVIPRDDGEKWDRGRLFGGLLNTAGDDTLADLALCEVACAEMDGIRSLLEKRAPQGEPLAIVVETAGPDLRALAIDPSLPPQTDPLRGGDDWNASRNKAEQSARDRIARLGEAIRSAVAADRDALFKRVLQTEKVLSPEEASALLAIADGKAKLDVPLADRGAAVLRVMAEEDPSRRERVIAALKQAAVERFRVKPPAGAKWASDTGCGADVEGDEMGMRVGCGMGFVPQASVRFLYFFSNP